MCVCVCVCVCVCACVRACVHVCVFITKISVHMERRSNFAKCVLELYILVVSMCNVCIIYVCGSVYLCVYECIVCAYPCGCVLINKISFIEGGGYFANHV